MTFALRDERLRLLAEAVATWPADDARVEPARAERAQWVGDAGTTSDAVVSAIGVDVLWRSPGLAADLRSDPVYRAATGRFLLTTARARAIDDAERATHRRAGFAAELRRVVGSDAARDAVVTAAYARWLSDAAPYPLADVGVLVPLRLETLFLRVPDTANDWLLRLRVVPESISVRGHDPSLSPAADDPDRAATHEARGELAAAGRFWRALGRTGRLKPAWLAQPKGSRAFAALAEEIGAARAAWVACATRGVRRDGVVVAEAIAPAAEQMPTVFGLPAQLDVRIWTRADGDGTLHALGQLSRHPADDGADPGEIDGELPLDVPSETTVGDNWLTDWTQAVRRGVAGEFPLPHGIGPLDIGGIAVVGVGDHDPGVLLSDHALSGALAAAPLGTAAHSVDGAPTTLSTRSRDGRTLDDAAPDVAAWRLAARRRLADPAGSTSRDPFHAALERYVGGPLPAIARGAEREDPTAPDVIGPAWDEMREAREADRDDEIPQTGLSRLLLRALWPVLWGRALLDEAQVQENAAHLTAWALEFVSPEGPLPSVRIGEEPYALLPITDLDGWRPPAALTYAADPLGILAAALSTMRRRLADRIRPGGTVSGPDGMGVDAKRSAALLTRSGVTRSILAHPHIADSALGAGSARPYREAVERVWSELGLDPSPLGGGLWVPPVRPWSVALPLVEPRHIGLMLIQEQWLTAPLPFILDAFHGLRARLRPHTDAPTHPGDLYLGETTVEILPPDQQRPHLLQASIDADPRGAGAFRVLPPSLLARLLVESATAANVWRRRQTPNLTDLRWFADAVDQSGTPLLWPTPADVDGDALTRAGIRVAELVDLAPMRLADLGQELPGSAGVPDVPPDAPLDPQLRARIERALGAVIDSVTTRIDPWATALAWTTLRDATAPDASTHRRLGAYGWVFGPFVGEPGPTDAGFIHTPSQAQTTTATIVRDRHNDARAAGLAGERGNALWSLRLSSDVVRLAMEIADDLRAGLHLYEVAGREVERLLGGDAGDYGKVRDVRRLAPMYDDRVSTDRVCDGVKALQKLLALDGSTAQPAIVPAGSDIESGLQRLREAIDALSDIVVIDGITHAVDRMNDRAGAAMEALAGDGVIPELTFPRSPATGLLTETTVLSVLPWAAPEPDAAGAGLAEPSLARFLIDRLGTDWRLRLHVEDDTVREVALVDLGLDPIAAMGWSPSQLAALAGEHLGLGAVTLRAETGRAWRLTTAGDTVIVASADLGRAPSDVAALSERALRSLLIAAAFPAGVPPRTRVRIDLVTPDVEDDEADDRMWSAWDAVGNLVGLVGVADLDIAVPVGVPLSEAAERRIRIAAGRPRVVSAELPAELDEAVVLAAMLGAPATPRDLTPAGVDAESSGPTWDELVGRYTAVHAAVTALQRQASAAGRRGAAGGDEQRAAIRLAARWGVTPDVTPADAAALYAVMLDAPLPPGATSLRDLARTVASALAARLQAAPRPSSLPRTKTVTTHPGASPARPADGIPRSIPDLARALSALAAPQSRIPVLIVWSAADLRALTHIDPAPRAVDDEWLTLVAPVRAALARLESVQLGESPLTAWASDPDPWLRSAIAAAHALRAEGKHAQVVTPRLTIAYGPANVTEAPRVAVGLIDAFAHAVPSRQRLTHAAFGFNAPAARAPHMVLLAAPPARGTRLDSDILHTMLVQTRELMIARTATPADLGEFDHVLRTIRLTDSTPSGILDPSAYVYTYTW